MTEPDVRPKPEHECYLCHSTDTELVIWREKTQCADPLICRLRMAEEIMMGDE